MSSFSLHRRVTTFMIYIAIVLFGGMSFLNLPTDLMPSFDIPIAIVSTSYSGAGSAEVESMVTKPLEQMVALVSNIENIDSSSSEGSSMIVVSFADGTNMSDAITDMREKVDMVSAYLPEGSTAPMIMAIDPDSMPIIEFAVSANTTLSSLEAIANDSISPNIERISGVASVNISGGYSNVINISTDSSKMTGYGLSIEYVSNILRATNLSMPSGEISYGDKHLTVRVDSEFSEISDIENIIIPLPRGGTVKLNDIATVALEPDEISTLAKVNGEEVVILSIQKQSGVNTSQVAKQVLEEINNIKNSMPEVEITILSDQSAYVDLSINSVMVNVILGVVFSVFVLFLFLKKVSPTLIIAISMPICLIATFLLMQGLGLTLNIMTLGGMAIGVGMIVDNSVVVLENIFRYKEEGNDKFTSCLEGAKEVALSIVASTITTIAVFLPVGLSGGMVGQIFNEFSLTITSLLVSSLFIALTLVPLLSYIFLDNKQVVKITEENKHLVNEENTQVVAKKKKPFIILYQGIIKAVIKVPALSLLVAFLIFVGFLSSTLLVGAELIPSMDQSLISISVNLPISSELKDTSDIADEIVRRIEHIEETDFIYYSSTNNSATVSMTLVELSQRERSVFEIGDQVRSLIQDIPGAKISVSDAGAMDMSALTGSAISLTIQGPELDELERISSEIVEILSNIDGAREVSSSASERVEQVNIRLKSEIATSYGLTPFAIGSAVSAELQGIKATTLSIDGVEIDVLVKGDPYSSSSIDSLKNVLVSTQTGAVVPLSMVADVSIDLGAHTINRKNQVRTVSITGSSYGVDSYTLTQNITNALEEYTIPNGYYIDLGGESEELIATFTSLFTALVIAVALVYFILASQFESIVLPFIVMLAMPLGLSGGIFGLFLTNTPISMPAFIGVIMLSGTVVNNSIVLIDYIRIRQENGEDIVTAMLTACPLRVRPVLMTTLTTILGLMPMALGIGEGSEMMQPMAIVMISGLAISTIVTLVFTPLFYYVLKKPKKNKKSKKNKEIAHA